VTPISWLSHREHSLLPFAFAAAISTPYLYGLRQPFDDRPKSTLLIYAHWPFFAWWAACLAFTLIAPLIALAALALGASTGSAMLATGLFALAIGVGSVIQRPRIAQHEITITDLPAALDGYRIGQISDVHCGSYTPPARVERWVRRLNALDLDLMTVTGDLITSGASYVAPVARALGALRARDGVFACMGNHDYFTDGELLVAELERHGITVLRNRGVLVARERASLFVAGVDDTWTRRHDVPLALAERPPGTATVLLAHDPNLFQHAVAEGVDLTLAGHTHGGQLAVPGFSRRLTLARMITEFTAGLYRRERSWLYVNRGAGTTGPPVRFGAAAELAVLVLRRSPDAASP
jgi:predicted MPP superfamily phosphohydrolase